ncbi:hypothetical protein [Sphingomonas sp. Leaf257]|jgi:hypothetical protein|uniref:hypothetical protein n=1 Tax=Sphingomonas sp. Leaf257 TaxID=1736309 RepID=UPI0006F46555|nr:hypothetical protein [Sphingomonas sp. Leaf257]KQO55500.1 hypothetical protein ASF14_03795 [Sphingomonas sp. Leaf257]
MAVAILAGAAILSWVAVANGFPLVFADSGTYLRIPLKLFYPTDRPPVYGLAIGLPLWITGVWGIVAVQAIGSVLMIAMTLAIIGGRLHAWDVVATCALLGLGSSLPWFVGQIMPDIATGFVPLVLFALLARPSDTPLWQRGGLAVLLALLIAVHLSHVLLTAGLLGLAAVAMLVSGTGWRETIRRSLPAALAIALTLLGLSGLNRVAGYEFRPALSSDTFLLARLFDGHVAQPTLVRLCRERTLAHCTVRPLVDDPLVAKPGQAYLWDRRSPLGAMLHRDRPGVIAEQRMIIRDVLHDDPGGVATLAWQGFAEQLRTVRKGVLPPYAADMQIARILKTRLPDAYQAFSVSRQQRGALDPLKFAPDVAVAVAVVLLLPVMLIWAIRKRRWPLLGLTGLVVATLLLNAAITGDLSGPDDRYQSRVLWLLPLLAACFVIGTQRRPVLDRADIALN